MIDKWLVLKASGGGGLGDSIKSLLVAAYYAHLSQRTLVVDWRGSVYAEQGVDVFAHLFKLKNITTQRDLPQSNSIFPPAWLGRLDKSLHDVYTEDEWSSWQRSDVIKTYSFDMSKLDYEHDVLVMWDFDQAHVLNRHINDAQTDMQFYQIACQRFLSFSDNFQAKIDQVCHLFPDKRIGVHIRATKEFDSNKAQLSLSAYISAVKRIFKNNQDYALFLATDNAEIQTQFKQCFPATMTIDKWFAKAGESLHMNQQCPDQLSNVSDALLDIVLLSNSSYIVVTPQSSFSEIAEIFSKSQNQNVVIIDPTSHSIWSKLKRLIKRRYI